MAMSSLLSPLTPLTPSHHHKPLLHSPLFFPLTHQSSLNFTNFSTKPTTTTTTTTTTQLKPRRRPFTTQSKGGDDDSIDPADRLISAVCYFYPFFDGIQYGKFVITQYTAVQTLIQPLIPAIKVFKSFPFNGFLVFLTLYFGIVRNSNFSRYVRFNTMQVIVLDVLLIFPDLVERTFNPKDGVGLDVLMSMDSTVFLFLLVCLIYGSASCVLGQVPRLPIVAEAAERQVP